MISRDDESDNVFTSKILKCKREICKSYRWDTHERTHARAYARMHAHTIL